MTLDQMPQTPLLRQLQARIAARGPMSVAEYMALTLGDPAHGYYTTRDPLGVAGDFTTAPEISQMFGEMIGLWLAAQARIPNAILAELGPGRGTLLADAQRAAPELAALPLWLVETSETLRAVQARSLPSARWIRDLHALPEAPVLLVANEFIDVLPVHQYIAHSGSWREVQVGIDDLGNLTFGLSGRLPPCATNPVPADGEWREASPAADATMAEIARRIGSLGGAALIIDYGYTAADRPEGPTLQAMRGHKRAHALDRPGEADLTWLPDFDALEVTARAAATVETWVTTQGQFLAELGIGLRAMALSEARPAATGAIADALERLTMAEAMGGAFKVLAITPAGSPRPLGFDPATALPRRRKAGS